MTDTQQSRLLAAMERLCLAEAACAAGVAMAPSHPDTPLVRQLQRVFRETRKDILAVLQEPSPKKR